MALMLTEVSELNQKEISKHGALPVPILQMPCVSVNIFQISQPESFDLNHAVETLWYVLGKLVEDEG